jgi:hypothetical protein
LPDEAGIDRCVEPAILGRDVIHSFAVSDIDEVQWSLGDKSCVPVSARIFLRRGASSLCAFGLVEPAYRSPLRPIRTRSIWGRTKLHRDQQDKSGQRSVSM